MLADGSLSLHHQSMELDMNTVSGGLTWHNEHLCHRQLVMHTDLSTERKCMYIVRCHFLWQSVLTNFTLFLSVRSHAEIMLWYLNSTQKLNKWISQREKSGLFLWNFIQKKTRYITCAKIYIKNDSIYEFRNHGHGWRNYKNISYTVKNFPLWSCL